MRRHTWVLVFTSVAVGVGSGAPGADAAAPPEWRALQSEMAAPYPALATPEGRFADYLSPGTRPLPVPTLGLALIQAGLANGDASRVDTGIRGINDYVEEGPLDGPPGVFDHFAIAAAYNVLRREQADNPLFALHRTEWERWLRNFRMHYLPRTTHYGNKYMVEAVGVLELSASGVVPTAADAVPGRQDRPEQMALHVLDDVAPGMARRTGTTVAGSPAMVLSDPSSNALAYHALTLGFFGRAVDMLGPRASVRARDALERVARASWASMGPDGDVAYIGRSQQQAWALTLTAYGAEVAADGADSTWAPRFHALADRALARLRDAHGIGPDGLWITPSGAAAPGSGRHGLDTYANGPGYSGLALVGLNWAIEHADRHDRASGAIASDEPAAWRLARGRTAFHAVRTPSSWFVVKPSPSSAGRDLRYDFGLVALKRPAPDSTWVDVVRPRPHTNRGWDSAGPVMAGRSGRALPEGTGSHVSGGGVVTVRGGYRSRRGRWLSRGDSFRFAPVDCGIRSTFTRRAGGALEYSVFFRDAPRIDGTTLTDGTTAVQASPRPAVALRRGYASGTDARLVRAVLRFPAGRSPVQVTTCGA